ncbi:MAG: DUF192 domain-containing protein [Ignavibacteriales bacterium]|nr:DUF192 domain-containing protein [Ignavibacteriales bacterium]
MTRRSKRITVVSTLFTAGLLAAAYLLYPRSTPEQTVSTTPAISSEPQFVKQGVLSFLRQKSFAVITAVDIEIADTDEKRMQGLMFRRSMSDSVGMLFTFPDETPQSFWMKNTIISLDIVYINAKKEIVSIQKYAEPYSERPLPSYKPAKFVVEVNAGFCDRYRIGEGDCIRF